MLAKTHTVITTGSLFMRASHIAAHANCGASHYAEAVSRGVGADGIKRTIVRDFVCDTCSQTVRYL